MAENSSKLGDMTKSSLDSIKAMLDANTIIGITVTPVAFLVVGADGKVDILNVNTPTQTGSADAVSSVVGFLERSPELIERIKSVFGRKNEENDI